MAKVTIVGAGQSGLQLGIGLVRDGHAVTLVSSRTPEDFAHGAVMSSQFMFARALDTERELEIDFWADTCPPAEGIEVSIPHPELRGQRALHFASRFDRPGKSVDQRVKYPRWMAHFASLGGELVIHDATPADLERYANDADLVIVAAGKGELAKLFARDAGSSPFDQPMRALALTYVHGMTPRPDYPAVAFNLCPGVGEYFTFPALTTSGPCDIMVMEGIPGGLMDCWGDVTTPAEHLARSKWLVDTFFPWEGERCRAIELTDARGILAGRFAPTVRRPVGTLPSGRPVLGMADVVVLNDPITGQGSNNAAKCAQSYLRAIRERGDGPFDAAWMQATFDRYWEYARAVTTWTNALLLPPPEHVLALLGAATQEPRVAHRFVNGFDDPRDYFEWFMDPAKASAYLASLAAAPA
jgi:hypothetical protein